MPSALDSLAEADDVEAQHVEARLETAALERAIFDRASFWCIGTDEKGLIQAFNRGVERMLGYAAADVINTLTPPAISDPQEIAALATAPSIPGTASPSGFEALVFKAWRGVEDNCDSTSSAKMAAAFPRSRP